MTAETGKSWTRTRDSWVTLVPEDQLLDVIAAVMRDAHLDENLGDTGERADTVLWLATRGAEGTEWGIAAQPAEELGDWMEWPRP